MSSIDEIGEGFFWVRIGRNWTLCEVDTDCVRIIGDESEYWRADRMFNGASFVGPLEVPDAA